MVSPTYEIIEIDQDPAGLQGTRVKKSGNLEVWCKPLGATHSGTKAVLLLNRGTTVTNIVANWSDIGLSGHATVRDLWAHEDLGTFDGYFSASVPAHSVVMVKVTSIILPRLELVENTLPLRFRADNVLNKKLVIEDSTDLSAGLPMETNTPSNDPWDYVDKSEVGQRRFYRLIIP